MCVYFFRKKRLQYKHGFRRLASFITAWSDVKNMKAGGTWRSYREIMSRMVHSAWGLGWEGRLKENRDSDVSSSSREASERERESVVFLYVGCRRRKVSLSNMFLYTKYELD